ncbi:MAG TPA: hypothetical protein VMH32_07635 [Burkholderiales bacterium]|nr:hypothetical protein [Burkholderiales bacterium]
MTSLAIVEAKLDAWPAEPDGPSAARSLLALAEEVLEQWILARGETPTKEQREGFRLLALHRQGAQGDPSFNACRETCREIAYHYNLLNLQPDPQLDEQRQRMMAMLAKHLALFVAGKMQSAKLGEFCCSSRALRTASA